MPDSFTTNLNLTKPEVGASRDTWGTKTNSDWDLVDAVFAGAGNGTSVGLNVGSGKTLAVAGTLNASGTQTLTGTTNLNSTINASTAVNLDAAVVINESGGDRDVRIEGDNDVNLLFTDASTDRVGVGTNAPGAKMTVYGAGGVAVSLNNSTTGTSPSTGFQLQVGGTTDAFLWNYSAGPLIFGTNNAAVARFDSSGNFGVGTVTPNTKMEVAGGSTTELRVVSSGNLTSGAASIVRLGGSNSATSGYFGYGGTSSQMDVWNTLAGALVFGTNNAERVRIDSSGNVGLGVVSPAARFDLGGDYKEGVVTANTGTAYTIALTGTVQNLTLTGNCTFTFPAATTAGRSFLLILRQDGGGNRTVTWPGTVRWPGGTAPTITATGSRYDLYAFTADGSVWLGRTIAQNYAA
jgi:hypothetical protein